MADTDPIQPFGANVAGVIGLLPHATFPDTLGVGQKGVTKTMVKGYLEDITGQVQTRLVGWSSLDNSTKQAIQQAARDLVHNGAASYTQAARFPEQVEKTDEGYAEVLWERFQTGLTDLEERVQGWLAQARAEKAAAEADCVASQQKPAITVPGMVITDTSGF